MIGCIVTGHGSFAHGMMGAVEMIAGKQEHFATVPFLEEESLANFEHKMSHEVERLLSVTDGVVIFSDLLGGAPFKTAMLVTNNKENVEVISGTNLPILLEGSGLCTTYDQVASFVNAILPAGKEGVVFAQLDVDNNDEQESEEGI